MQIEIDSETLPHLVDIFRRLKKELHVFADNQDNVTLHYLEQHFEDIADLTLGDLRCIVRSLGALEEEAETESPALSRGNFTEGRA